MLYEVITDKVAVGTPIAQLRSAEETPSAPPAPAPADAVPPAPVEAATETEIPPAPVETAAAVGAPLPVRGGPFIAASPAARQLAQQKGITLVGIQGSGPEGAILLKDVEALMQPAAEVPTTKPTAPATPAAPTAAGFDFAAMRQAISATVTRSKREIPHYYLSQTLDISRLELS